MAKFGLALLFMGWNAPNHYPPWTTLHLELFAAFGLCLLSIAVMSARLSRSSRDGAVDQPLTALVVRVPLPLSARLWLLLALLPVLQFALGQLVFRGDALLGVLYVLGSVSALYVGLLWAAQRGRSEVSRTLHTTIVAAGLAACGLALAQWLRLGTAGWWAMELIDDRPYANLAQPNQFGLLMVIAIVSVTALFETGAVSRRWVWAMAVGFLGSGVLMSQSRSAALALSLISILWMLTRTRLPTRLRWSDFLIGAVTGLLLCLLAEPFQRLILIHTPELRATAEIGPRQWIWLHFGTAILQHPWTGYGFNQGVAALAEVAGQVHPSRNVVFAHNLVLDLMTWFGVPLALLMTGALACWMWSWLRSDPSSALMAQRHWVFAIWLALLVQSMLEFPYAHGYFLLPAALLAGSVLPLPMRSCESRGACLYEASHWVKAMAGVAAVLLLLLSWEYLQLEADFRASRFYRANFANLPARTPRGPPLILDQLSALNASADVKIAPGMSTAELEQMRVLARRFHMLSVRLDYAKALALNSRLNDAQHELLIIRSVVNPVEYESIQRGWSHWLTANRETIGESKSH